MISKKSLGLVGMLLSTLPTLATVGHLRNIEEQMPPQAKQVEAITSRLVVLVSNPDSSYSMEEIDRLLRERQRIISMPSYRESLSSYRNNVEATRQWVYYAAIVGAALVIASFYVVRQEHLREEQETF